VALAVVMLGSCSDSSSSSYTTAPSTPETATTKTVSPHWAKIDGDLAALGPNVGFLAARVSDDGTCEPIHAVNGSTARPTGSQFKLFVLGALAEQIAAGKLSWDQTVTVEDSVKSLGNGEPSLQFAAPGTAVPVEEAATKMIEISDNTAADILIGLVGRDAVEAQVAEWAPASASVNEPFLTTRQMLLLHYVPGLADQYLATPPDQRAAFLASSVDPHPIGDIAAGYSTDPRYIDDVEWFASPAEICGAFAGLQQLSTNPTLSPLDSVLSREVGKIGLDAAAWPTVWFKGGSEAGVLTLGWLATNADGETYVVEGMVSNPDAALAENVIYDLVALGHESFGVLGEN
jgi:hypothetical protein